MITSKATRSWTRKGNGWTCPPWDIGAYYIDGTTLQVLWRGATLIGHFEDAESAMDKAKEIERTEKSIEPGRRG